MGFNRALEKLLRHEGGYVNNKADSGGETICGISRKWYPQWSGWALVDQGLRETSEDVQKHVYTFYYTFYWVKLRLDDVQSDAVAELLFNFAVNIGKKTMVKKIQRILKVKQDGLIGDKTVAALNAYDDEKFIYHMLLELLEFYVQLGKEQPIFVKGWVNRVVHSYYDYQNSLY